MKLPLPLRQILLKIAASRPGAWLLARSLHHLDRGLLRLSGGRSTVSQIVGLPMVTLTTTGARTGLPRTVPLIAVPDGERLLLVASNWGRERPPAWYYNLRAHPLVTVATAGESASYRARLLSGDERDAAWSKAVSRYPGYAAYRRRTRREIPVVALEPHPSPSPQAI